MARLRTFWPLSLIAASGLFGWLQSVPSLPAGHDGLCRSEIAAGVEYLVCDVPLDRYDLTLRAVDAGNAPFRTFERAAASVDGRVRLIMNAGMYHEDRRPVGLAVQDGVEVSPLVRGTGSGNYSMQPNGVFFVENGRAAVLTTDAYLAAPHQPTLATQSGPILLIDGKLHPRFIDGSDSRHVRNGVCASADGRTVRLVLSRSPVNFWDFAVFFRDRLGCSDALFFDGKVSSLSYPDGSIDYRRDRLGPMLVVSDKTD